MDPDLVRRVETLEETVDSLRDLPARTASLEVRMGAVELQIVQLRGEMRDEFSAIRREMVTKDEFKSDLATLRMATKADVARLAGEMVATMASKADLEALRLEVREDIAGLGREMAARILESESRTRVLFEDVVSRIATGHEGPPRA
jgi:predicted nucleic acid-binding OB-fold protein